MRTLVIGRSPFADVIIADASVAPHHAELVVLDDGRLHLTDCATETGTWRYAGRGGGAEGRWEPVRQAFIGEDDALRIGEHASTARELIDNARESPSADDEGRSGRQREYAESQRRRLRGRVERDPVTGEIIRRRP